VDEQVSPAAEELVTLWRRMVLLRAVDERATTLQRQGRMGAYPVFWGEEGIQAAAVTAVRPTDWLFLSYRQNAVPVLRGLPPERVFLYFRGDPQSFFDPFEFTCAPQAVPVSTQLPHAVGWAWGRRLDGHDDVAVAFFGDGATSEGDFHEAMNIAAVHKAPVVFLCTNNQWAISTPVARQTAVARIADKAVAYGMPGERVDGFDAPAVLQAVRRAAERARAGEGPFLIEAFCYRIGPHATADDPSLYRDPAESEHWREREPVSRLRRQLVADGVLSDEDAEGIEEDARQELAEAAERLDNVPPAGLDHLVRSVYASPPPGLVERLQELRS
jgi:TPP-dependent pyruvate/acetoin dehydrogenase alpha subunit